MKSRSEGLRDSTRRLARQLRIEAIIDGARVRQSLDQGAAHELAVAAAKAARG